jgi:2-haloacid dehalogenase
MADRKQSPAIIFDFGDVLINWSSYNLYRKIFQSDSEIELFLEEIKFREWNLKFDKGYSFEHGVKEMSAMYPRYAYQIQCFHDRWIETVGEPIQGSIDILCNLKRNRYPVYGLSNWSNEKFSLVKAQLEFLPWLDDYVVSGQVNAIKPEAEIFQILLGRIGRPAEECIFIDDSLVNITAAHVLGFKAILFQTPEKLRQDLELEGIDCE